MTPRPLIILGAGGNSLSILDAVDEINRRAPNRPVYDLRGFLDDLPQNRGTSIFGRPVLGRVDQARDFDGCWFINGVASPATYLKKPEVIARSGIPADRFETVIHPAATVSPNCRVGIGTTIMANSVICAGATIGNHVIILQNTVVNHHSAISDYVTLSSGITILGFTDIGENAFIGGAASIRPHIRIGARALVGMASVVVKDVPDDAVVAGNPARPLKPRASLPEA
ncbi:acetyltransferase [Ferrovibrio xuzhouensis]|uniref:Acetyltransferase n=1 Tax=Ferrovibrio xuzhouensis TaxID=1576914 RepID=A0ABV7VKU0_9PROT